MSDIFHSAVQTLAVISRLTDGEELLESCDAVWQRRFEHNGGRPVLVAEEAMEKGGGDPETPAMYTMSPQQTRREKNSIPRLMHGRSVFLPEDVNIEDRPPAHVAHPTGRCLAVHPRPTWRRAAHVRHSQHSGGVRNPRALGPCRLADPALRPAAATPGEVG